MQTFTKAERLCSKIIIDKIFESGKTLSVPSLKLLWIKEADANKQMAQILVSVPKRAFKKAVDRNKLKRRIREAYRKNKTALQQQENSGNCYLVIIYTDKKIIEYKQIEEKIVQLLKRLSNEINNSAV